MKKTPLALGLAAGIALAAASLLTALPASALATVGATESTFLTYDIENSVVSKDGSTIAYSGYGNSDVWLLDTATNTPSVVLDSDSDLSEPGMGSFSPDGQTLYIPDYDSGYVVVIDVATASVTGTLTSADFSGPWLSVISPDGQTLYVSDYSNETIVTYNLSDDTTSSVSSVASPYFMTITPDGSTIYNMDADGTIDVFDTASGNITNTFNGPSGDFSSACTNSTVSVLYMPSSSNEVFAVSLTDGATIASNLVDLPSNGNNYSCAVSPDDSKVFVTNDDIGAVDDADYTVVTTPGIITEFAADTLTLGETYEFSGVAFTQMMNFYDECNAFVAGYYGNAQSFNFDDACVVGAGEEAQSGIGSEAALANTGVDAFGTTAIVILMALAGGLALVARRRLALK